MLATLSLLAALTTPAFAQDEARVPFETGEVQAEGRGITLGVREMVVPLGLKPPTTERRCIVQYAWGSEGAVPDVIDCAGRIKERMVEIAGGWVFDVEGEPKEGQPLFEVWYYFDADPEGLPEVLLQQAHDLEWTVRADEVGVLPFRVRQRAFAYYPEAARGVDTADSRCDVRIHVTSQGLPREPEVMGCDEVFHDAAATALRGYRFAPPKIHGSPASSSFLAEVAFLLVLEDGEVTGKAEVSMPGEVIGLDQTLDEAPPETPIAPRPTWDPLVVLDHGSYAEVGIYSMVWPDLGEQKATRECSLLFQVDSLRRVLVWPEACDDDLAPTIVAAATQWVLMPGEVEKGERFARFRADLVFPDDDEEHPYLRVPKDDLVSVDGDTKDRVRTYARAAATKRVPPKLPATFDAEVDDSATECMVSVLVGTNGRAQQMQVDGCDQALVPFAEKAVKQWRWDPAEQEGQAIATRATVRMKFTMP